MGTYFLCAFDAQIININVAASEGMSAREIADEVMERMQDVVNMRSAVFA